MNKEIKKVLEDMCFDVREHEHVEFSNGCNFSNVIEVKIGYERHHCIICFRSDEIWVLSRNSAIASVIIDKTIRGRLFKLGYVLGGLR